jgi:ElaB/YqjD/DUF883 family membrane-anchored ribosome-binding protein
MADNTRTEGARPQDRAREKVAEIGSGIADMSHRVMDTVQEKVHDLRDLASDMYAASKEKLSELEESFVEKVRTAPVKSVLIAAGVGVLLGFLWRRR